ncbi:MAG TPA: hypothetical protein VK604_14675 [Bryobacteraceae bacterium]|nr:hypothetical protein [Bryobacteraceae bacterium]
MSRLLIQCLTIVTMLASILHAQCLAVCSLQAAPHAATIQSAHGGEHSCCPHPGDQKSQNSEKPCPPNSPAFSPASTEASSAASVVLPAAILDHCGGVLLPVLDFHARLAPAASADRPGLSLRSSISILRI